MKQKKVFNTLDVEELMIKYNPLLWNLAKKVSTRHSEYEDLVSIGKIVIIESIKKFNPKKGNKFITYIYQSILNRMTDYRIKNSGQFTHSRGYCYYISRAEKLINMGMDIDSALDQFKHISKTNKKSVKIILGLRQARMIKLDRFLDQGTDKNFPERTETKIDSGQRTDIDAFKSITNKRLYQVLDTLPRRQGNILKLYYGIKVKQITLDEIGATLKITRERVRQLRDIGLNTLKERYIAKEHEGLQGKEVS